MSSETRLPTDLVEEFVLRRWAREHYVPIEAREDAWHPVILDEMKLKDRELAETTEYPLTGRRIVPLVPESDWILHGPHSEPTQAALLLRVPDVAAGATAESRE